MSKAEHVCIFRTALSGEGDQVAALLKHARLDFQRRAILEQGEVAPEERFYVAVEQEDEARAVLGRWLDARPKQDSAPALSLLLSSREPQDLSLPSPMVVILPPGIFAVCLLFWQKAIGLSFPASLLLSLPLPIGIYFMIRKAQSE